LLYRESSKDDYFLKGGILTEATTTISTIISNVGDIFTGAMSWAAEVGSTIVETPLLLCFVVLPLVGLGIGIFKRLLNM